MFFSLQYHVVRSESGIRVLPRTPQHSLALAWADVRTWTPSQWTDRLELARAAMAAGATDLIADSVRIPLQEEVSESAATLDELRGFLNSTRDRLQVRPGGREVEAKRAGRLASVAEDLQLDHEDSENIDSGLIPLPGEIGVADLAPAAASALRALNAANPSPSELREPSQDALPADPFRSPATASSARPSASSPGPSSPTRVSNAAVREGLTEHSGGGTEVFGPADVGGMMGNLSSSASARAARLLQDAEDFERSIFGDVSGRRGSPLQPLSAAVNPAPAELEKAARQLLESAQKAAADGAVEQPWIRGPGGSSRSAAAAGTAPVTAGTDPTSMRATGPGLESTAKPNSADVAAEVPDSASTDEEPGMSFDPFLEADSEGNR